MAGKAAAGAATASPAAAAAVASPPRRQHQPSVVVVASAAASRAPAPAPAATRRPRSLLQRLLGAGRRTGDAFLSVAVSTALRAANLRAGAGAGAAGPSSSAQAKKRPGGTSSTSSSSSTDNDGDDGGPWLIVGLGNPGPRYDHTRHNVGFAVVDALAASEGIDVTKLDRQSGACVGAGAVAGRRVLLAKPMTFINVSGESVGRIVRQRGIPHARVLVVSDDLDSPLGRVRLRAKGGHGGHNGLRSIVQHLGGTHDFPRLKIGIGRPAPDSPVGVAEYVLQRFAPGDRAAVDGAVAESLRAIDALLAHGLERAMSGAR